MNLLRIHKLERSRRTGRPVVLVLILAALALAAGAACGSSGKPSSSAAPRTSSESQSRHYGHIASLLQTGGRFQLRFDPAQWLTGAAAERAAVAAKAIDPGQPVPNDYFIVDDAHSVVSYAVPATARVTVLTKDGDPQKLGATPISGSELAQIRRLTEPRAGFWLRIGSGSVLSLDQQYQP